MQGKTILITGGTGSFGQAFTRYALDELEPRAIRILSRDEKKQADMLSTFDDDPRLRWLIGDVRDKERMSRACTGVDYVIHAAALKRIEVCHYNVEEAIKTNVLGALNVAQAALERNVEKVIALSTDKAPEAPTLYGRTKAVMEDAFINFNAYASHAKTRYSIVRYGNVIASRGSVVELWRKQAETGTVDITDEHMTRFWITLDQAVRFVAVMFQLMQGGEIFIPKIPSMRIVDLAEAIAPGAKRRVIGMRPGERLHEILIAEEEARHTKDLGTHYVIEPEYHYWQKDWCSGGKSLPSDFQYRSDTNTEWLTMEKMRKLLGG